MSRWTPLIDTPEQVRLRDSGARFNVVAAGRRSGKTERAKRRLVWAAATCDVEAGGNFIACAPTRDQAKRIFWDDLVSLSMTVPGIEQGALVERIVYSDLAIKFVNGSTLQVIGLDKPQRAEGVPIDGAVVDEIAECKQEAWTMTLRPALSTRGRPGWCWFTGRPKGKGWFYELWRDAKAREDWDSFHWHSSEILPAEEIEAARRDLDPLTFRQEYEADFITFEGLAYYQWNANVHMRQCSYQPHLPLVFCFDFNVEPGVAAVIQEQDHPVDRCQCGSPVKTGEYCKACNIRVGPQKHTCVIGEVHIPRNSNTPAVCNKLIQEWGHHKGPVYIYGDASGSQRRTSAKDGNDWDQVRSYLGERFRDLNIRVPRANPHERDRVNSVNTRLMNSRGDVRLMVDPKNAPHVIRDFESVCVLEGGSGEIDKKKDSRLTHLSDAIGYYVHAAHPLGGHVMSIN